MINIISVKWGTKYSSNDVNKLHEMVDKNLSIPFAFYCLTENPVGLDTRVLPIQITEDLDGVWNKLLMFKEFKEGTNLYFDIDTIIQNPIDNLLDYVSKDLTMVKCYWKDIEADQPEWVPTLRNSSILLWRGDLSYIWEEFDKDPDANMVRYLGIDRWLEDMKIPANYFPRGLIYSRLYGKDLNSKDEWADSLPLKLGGQEYCAYYFEDYLVCLFNGPVTPAHYERFI